MSLQELFAGRNVDLAASQARMRGLMAQEGLPYGERTHTYNSRLAQELGAWAVSQEGGEAIHEALFQAYFVGKKNIGEIDTLVELAASVGLSADAARQVLGTRRTRALVDADWQRARTLTNSVIPQEAS